MEVRRSAVHVFLPFLTPILPFSPPHPEKSDKVGGCFCLFVCSKNDGQRRHIVKFCLFPLHSLYLTVRPLSSPKSDWLQKFQSA